MIYTAEDERWRYQRSTINDPYVPTTDLHSASRPEPRPRVSVLCRLQVTVVRHQTAGARAWRWREVCGTAKNLSAVAYHQIVLVCTDISGDVTKVKWRMRRMGQCTSVRMDIFARNMSAHNIGMHKMYGEQSAYASFKKPNTRRDKGT